MSGTSARLFFAAWPGRDLQEALGGIARDLQRECGGRAVPARNIHLTLVFLGDVGRDRLGRFQDIAAAIPPPGAFELSVDHAGYWRHNRVVWAGVKDCPAALPELVSRLGQALEPEGIRPERRQYVPHVTLLRDALRPPATAGLPAFAWRVARYALVESVPRERGRAYEVLQDWPLTA